MTGIERLRRALWRRHRNPWSGWTRVALGPALAVAIWLHSWPWIALLVLALLTNPFWFPPPERDDAWMTRAVDGERLWLARTGWLEWALVMLVPGLILVPLIAALWANHLGWSLFLGLTLLLHKALFVVHAARLADGAPPNQREPP
jgi:hypothetical protein